MMEVSKGIITYEDTISMYCDNLTTHIKYHVGKIHIL